MLDVWSKRFFVFCFSLGLIFTSWSTLFAFVSCKSGKFVNSQGKEVFFRGIGLGGWLVPEGYMLHMPGYGSPSAIDSQIVDVIGQTNAQIFWKNYRKNYVNQKDIQQIAQWGFNLIRLPFHYNLLSPANQPGTFLEEGFALLDSLIQWCKTYRLYVILDMHCAPGGQNADNISDSDGQEARLWTDVANQDRTVEIWQKIAERYASDTTVVGYDLLNEPVLPEGHSPTELRALYMRITSAIRQVDSNHVVFVEGNWYATDFTALTPPWDGNMAYSFHKYWSETSTETIQSYLNIRKTYGIPLWMGESGENSNHWFASAVKLFEENNISWCWWTHKKFETTTSPFSAPLPAGFETLVQYWEGQGSKPTEAYALSILLQLSENLKIEKCNFLPDVLQALLNPRFLGQSTPYISHEIPGTVDCVNYDFGGNEVAYYDQDYQRTRWDVYTPWNNGQQYRNDGVDIEASKDANGAPFSIGWIESGEWLKYTIQVNESGLYEVRVRIAAAQEGGQLQLFINGQALTQNLTVPKTGGWYNWQTMTINDVPLEAGEHILTLNFLNGGFNINRLEFVLTTALPGNEKVPLRFSVGQNYPNPFNGVTRIPFTIEGKGKVTLEIFNLNGQRVYWAEQKANGQGYFTWPATEHQKRTLASGIYWYRVQNGSQSQTRKMLLLK